MKTKKKLKARQIKKLVSAGVGLLLILLVYFGVFNNFEYRFQDMAFQQQRLIHPSIAILGIDEEALEMFGQWPWPREVIAEAIEILNSDIYGDVPAVIALDIM